MRWIGCYGSRSIPCSRRLSVIFSCTNSDILRTMYPQDWFGLILRGAGVWLIIQSAQYLAYSIDSHFRISIPPQPMSPEAHARYASGYLLHAVIYAALAWVFVFRADFLAHWSFGRGRPTVPVLPPSSPTDPKS